MIDNSLSTLSDQFSLRAQLPKLVHALVRGDGDGDGEADFPPVTSLHFGVVSSDLGLPGIDDIDLCDEHGDEAIMNDVPNPKMSSLLAEAVMDCEPSYPRFLRYDAATDDADQFARDAACVAALGEDGCGFEQQLESALRALWPADDDGITFAPDAQGRATAGQGHGGGANAGFLRSAPEDASLLVVVLLSDEDDCSRPDSRFLTPHVYLDPSIPEEAALLAQSLRTRCVLNPDRLYPTRRYLDAFKALRPGREDRVLFAAIAGVPPETVARVPDDYGSDGAARDAFYDAILDHPDMQVQIDTGRTESLDDDRVAPACNSQAGPAKPARRIVEVARGFGGLGMVQSVCGVDFGPAMDAIVARIADRLRVH